MGNTNFMITLKPVREEELQDFKKRIQEAFRIAVEENVGKQDEPIPDDRELEEAFYGSDTMVYHILQCNEKVGGAVLGIHPATQRNSLDFFFISPKYHNEGFGQAAWKAIEEKYPDTEVWETVTPYFEKRNIHFYVNKCGFKIIKFWNEYYPEPHEFLKEIENGLPYGCDESFYFEKVMK